MTRCRKRAAGPPSTTRWSKVRLSATIFRTAIRSLASSTTTARARAGRLTPDDLADGTVTLTNLGAEGVDVFTPILNPPQAAILGVGRIAPRPVVRDAQAKAVQAIAAETATLIAQARAGNAPHDAMQEGTFTITNLGMYEIDAFTPIINLPECAILGIGRIVARPVVIDEATETVAVRKMVALSLTFDHRVVDGGPAARFLQRVKRYVEQPLVWLTS